MYVLSLLTSLIPILISLVLYFKKSPKIELTQEETITPKILLSLILPVSLVIWILMTNHIERVLEQSEM